MEGEVVDVEAEEEGVAVAAEVSAALCWFCMPSKTLFGHIYIPAFCCN